jgi:hypothetical protein
MAKEEKEVKVDSKLDEVKALKAQAYDLLAMMEQAQAKLQQVNQKIKELQDGRPK